MAEVAGSDMDDVRNVAGAVGRLLEAIERDCNEVAAPLQAAPDLHSRRAAPVAAMRWSPRLNGRPT
jgi:hypothetical protein